MYSHFIIASTQLYLVANDVSCTCARWSHSSEPLSWLLSSSPPYRCHHVLSFCLQLDHVTIDCIHGLALIMNKMPEATKDLISQEFSGIFSLEPFHLLVSVCLLAILAILAILAMLARLRILAILLAILKDKQHYWQDHWQECCVVSLKLIISCLEVSFWCLTIPLYHFVNLNFSSTLLLQSRMYNTLSKLTFGQSVTQFHCIIIITSASSNIVHHDCTYSEHCRVSARFARSVGAWIEYWPFHCPRTCSRDGAKGSR